MGEAVVKKKQIIEQALDEGITDIHELAMLADTTPNAASVTKSAWKKKRERMVAEESGKMDEIVTSEEWPEMPGTIPEAEEKPEEWQQGPVGKTGKKKKKTEKEDKTGNAVDNADRHLCKTCAFRATDKDHGCDYITLTEHPRGCRVEDCTRYERGKRRPLKGTQDKKTAKEQKPDTGEREEKRMQTGMIDAAVMEMIETTIGDMETVKELTEGEAAEKLQKIQTTIELARTMKKKLEEQRDAKQAAGEE